MDFLWFLHDIRSPVLTVLFRFFTLFGEEIIAVGLLCLLYWSINKKIAIGMAVSFFISAMLVQGLKILIRIERPWILDPAFVPIAEAIGTATGYSFPSGHTQTAAALFGYLGMSMGKKRWAIGGWVLAALVGLSRMYLGVHTPLDVIGAFAITVPVVLIVRAYMRSGKSDAPLVIAFGVLSALALIAAFVLHGQGVIELHYVSDCVKAAGGCLGCALGMVWTRRKVPFSTETPKDWQQLPKLLIGILGVLACKSGLKLLLGDSLVMDAIRYALIALWVLTLYPILFSKVLRAGRAA